MPTRTLEVKEKDIPPAAEATGHCFPERLWQGQIDRTGNTAQRRRIAQNRCLLAGLQLPEPGHDLSAGQSAAEGTPQAGAHQEPAARTLGSKPRPRHLPTFTSTG